MVQKFKDLAGRLASTASRLEKEAILAEFKDDEDIKFALNFLYNPYIVTGISEKKLRKAVPAATNAFENLKELLGYFLENNTGKDSDIAVLKASCAKIGECELVYALCTKELKLGIQEKTLNKVFGEDFIPTMSVMLAESYADNIGFVEGKEFLLTEKFDGVRCVLIFTNGAPAFFSRNGRAILDLVELEHEAALLDKDFVYDGELILATGDKMDSADRYRATVKITSSDNKKTNINFFVFDKIRKSDFEKGFSQTPTTERKASYESELTGPAFKFIKAAPVLFSGANTEKIAAVFAELVAAGAEGIMINIANAPYTAKRSKNLLKVKKFHAADVLVTKLEEGSGANRGKLGAVIVKFVGPDKKYHSCRVGSGFKQDEREYFWQNPDAILDKIIEIGYFEISKNQNDDGLSLRFPTFKWVRDDKAEISMH